MEEGEKKRTYKRMVCWVRPHEKEALKKEVDKKFPLRFVNNVKTLKRKIKEGDYIVVAQIYAKDWLPQLQDIARTFKNNTIALYTFTNGEDDLAEEAGELMWEPNVIGGLFAANNIAANFIGIIPDLEKDVEENYHVEFGLEDGSPGARVVHN